MIGKIIQAASLALLPMTCLAAAEKPVLISQAIDFLDNACFTERGDYYSKEELAERVRAAYDAGIRRIYFRGTGGVAYYPSRLRHPYIGGHNAPWENKLIKTIAAYDPVAEYIKVCHELGMELYYWEPVFDTSLYAHFFPGTEKNQRYGEWPFRDMSIRDEHYMAHRFADRPVENLARPIREIRLYAHNVPEITAENLVIYTAGHGETFKRYDQPFTVEVKPEGTGADVVIGGLNITDPVIKFMSDGEAFQFLSEPKSKKCAAALYDNGEPVDLFTACEIALDADDEPEKTLSQPSGVGLYWGKGKKSFIVRFGDFERYAIGVPEYAYPENRERLKAIVSELYERYPDLDGVTFSIRSHSLPSGGNYETVGDLFYGFSEPVVREYRRRYGVDPTREPYDREKLLKLRGEYFTRMLEEVAEIVHANGGRFECMAPVRPRVVGSFDHGSMFPWWYYANIDNFFDIETWAKKGIVDNVIMLGTGHLQREWTPGWEKEVAAFRAKLAGTDTRLTLHYLINDGGTEIKTLLPEVLKSSGLDGVEFYEEQHMWAYKAYPWVSEVIRNCGRPVVGVSD